MSAATLPSGQRGALAGLALPAVAFTLLLIAFPFIYTVWLSFRHVELGGASSFVGAQNYTISSPTRSSGTRSR